MQQAFAQDAKSGGGVSAKSDVSNQPTGPTKAELKADRLLKRKETLQDFYRSELRKGTITDERKTNYTAALNELEDEIKAIRAQRISDATKKKDTDPSVLEAEILNASFRELDIAIADSAPPMILANEPRSLLFNAGVSFLSIDKYSAPFTFSVEKVLTEKLGVGGYLGHFLEKVIDDKLFTDSNEYFNSSRANYKHTYINFGAKASYHFLKPDFILTPLKFDPYVTAILGYTIKTGTHPFLSNEEFLPYDAEGKEVNVGEGNGAFLNPEKKGINFGVFGGFGYVEKESCLILIINDLQ